MNCEEFESLLHSLVAGRLLDTVRQNKALGHVESCSHCSTRLQNERLLASGLKALAAETREKGAPARIEEALLDAFRGQKNRASPETRLAVPAHSIEGNHTNVFSGTRTGHANGRAWLIGAAASALLLAGIGFTHWRDRFAQRASSQTSRVNVLQSPPSSKSLGQVPAIPQTLSAPLAAVPKVEKGTHARKTQNPNLHRTGKQSPGSTSKEEIGRREVDTNFLPLMAASPLEPTESGHLIRMNLPRSTLGRFGFPINSERSEEPIKADVLIGEDGVARAIRFVYTAENVPSSDR
jgi:hypothetical protein